ncbi:MAG: His-Xaa-Ser system radical SAM maturase HxsB [Polyangiaceae bacterium]
MFPLQSLGVPPKSTQKLLPFRFRPVADRVLLTTDFGDFAFVSPDELKALYRGELSPELEDRLAERGFIRDRVSEARLVQRLSGRRRFLRHGPNLSILVVTLRCNETCVYCHASRAEMSQVETDMSRPTAEKAVELALQTTSPRVTIEFQGGEPLVNFDVMRHAIEYALEKNKAYGKELEFTLVSNLALLDDEKLDYLVANKVQICTSIDGPELLHNKQRVLPSGNAYQKAAEGIRRVNARYREQGLDPVLYHVEALPTITRGALGQAKAIVDTFVDLGCLSIFLRPVDPFGFAGKTQDKIEYDRAQYMQFYREALDYILELNRGGTRVMERYAAIFLTKILTGEDPNFLDIRSPGGAGLGQLTFNYDGAVYTSDEGRMLAETGDPSFCIGHVDTARYRDLIMHDTIRALVLASNLDGQPDCVSCTYNPYCGNKPEHNYRTQGSIFGRMRESDICAVHKGIQDVLFEKLLQEDESTLDTFRRWTTVRERAHFLQST